MTITDIERMALDAARDPKCGLFEILWTVNAQRPSWDPDRRLEASQAAVRSLVNRGYLQLHKGHWDEKDELGMYPQADWGKLLADPYVWERPERRWYVIARLTPAGEAALDT